MATKILIFAMVFLVVSGACAMQQGGANKMSVPAGSKTVVTLAAPPGCTLIYKLKGRPTSSQKKECRNQRWIGRLEGAGAGAGLVLVAVGVWKLSKNPTVQRAAGSVRDGIERSAEWVVRQCRRAPVALPAG